MKTIMATAITFLLFACSKSAYVIESEVFNRSDRPYFEYNSDSDYYFCKPWNYEKDFNSERSYPLVIYLHSAGAAGKISYLNYLGYDSKNIVDNTQAKNFQLNYPSFVLVPQTADTWNNDKLISLVEEFKKKYRIDNCRIYLIGYSMGGSGSYSFANSYYDFNKQLFAGIIRLAGQSQTVVRDEIAKKTAIWLQIGLEDTELRINITREAYDFLKKYHSDAVETTQDISVSGYSGTTLTLTKENKEIVKKTEYKNVGHGIGTFPFNDSSLIKWLFHQKIEY